MSSIFSEGDVVVYNPNGYGILVQDAIERSRLSDKLTLHPVKVNRTLQNKIPLILKETKRIIEASKEEVASKRLSMELGILEKELTNVGFDCSKNGVIRLIKLNDYMDNFRADNLICTISRLI